MKRYIKLFIRFFKTSYLLFLAHRFDFVMSSVANTLWTFSQVITLMFLSTKITAFNNWGFYDLILLLGLSQVYFYGSYILYENSLSKLFDKIVSGDFDRALTKPINIKFTSSFENFSVSHILSVFTTCIPLLVIGLAGLNIENLSRFPLAILLLTSGFISMYFLNLGLSGLTFILEDIQSFKDFFVSSSTDLSRLPMDLFPSSVKTIATYIVPLAFTTYYPVITLKGDTPLNIIILSFVLPVFFYLFQKFTWSTGLKHYSGVS